MRKSIAASLLLPAVLCLAGKVAAQSCVAATNVQPMVQCVRDGFYDRCDPGNVTLVVSLLAAGGAPATCPTDVTWNFGDGSPTQTTTATTSTTTLGHMYSVPGEYTYTASISTAGGPRSASRTFHVTHGYFQLALPSQVAEGSVATAVVSRSASAGSATVDYASFGHVATTSGTLAFAPGETHKQIALTVADDQAWNGSTPRYGGINLTNPTGTLFRSGSPLSGSFGIEDDDLPTVHRCAQSAVIAREDDGHALIEIERTGNTAVASRGYAEVYAGAFDRWLGWVGRESIDFAPGETKKVLPYPLLNDYVYGGTQTAIVTCGGQVPPSSPATTSIRITLTDDEPFPTLTVDSSVEVDETDATQRISIPVSITPPFELAALTVRAKDDTTSDNDYELFTSYLGHVMNTTIELDIVGDDRAESDERLIIAIDGPITKRISVVIRDDDRPPFDFDFEKDSYDFTEKEAAVIIERSGDLSSAVALTLNVRPVAVAQPDSIPVQFAPGEASKFVEIPLDNATYSGIWEATLELELNGFVGATAQATVQDDETMPSLAIGDASAGEGAFNQTTVLEVPLMLSAPLGVNLPVRVSMVHGTTDHRDVNGPAQQTVTIPLGELTAKAIFEITGDADLESDETFTVVIEGCCGALASVARGTATATIRNDDGASSATYYRVAAAPSQVKETDHWLDVTLRRSGQLGESTTATVELIANGSRIVEPAYVRFFIGETEKNVRLWIDDDVYTGDVEAQLEVSARGVRHDSARVRIVENEPARITARADDIALLEPQTDTTIYVRLNLSPPSRFAFRMNVRTKNSTATSSDFVGFNTSVQVPARARFIDVPVTILADSDIEQLESFSIEVDDQQFPATSVHIRDNDSPYLDYEQFLAAGATRTFTLHLPAPVAAQETLGVFALPQEWGTSGAVATSGSVVIPAGARSVTFDVRGVAEGPARVRIGLPLAYNFQFLTVDVWVYAPREIVAAPQTIEVEPGVSTEVALTITPDITWWRTPSVAFADPSLAAADVRFTETERKLVVHGIRPGTTELTVTLSKYEGGAVLRIPIVVREPGARHRGVRK